MKAVVVYDSVFGNTEQIARAIGGALGPQEDVETLRVSQAELGQLVGLDLLIVGSPTRAFSPTPAIKRFVRGIPAGSLEGVKVAAFDTRMAVEEVNSRLLTAMVKLFGYAAKPIAARLTRKAGELIVPPEGFYVEGSEGPLKEGELERAADWTRQITAAQ